MSKENKKTLFDELMNNDVVADAFFLQNDPLSRLQIMEGLIIVLLLSTVLIAFFGGGAWFVLSLLPLLAIAVRYFFERRVAIKEGIL